MAIDPDGAQEDISTALRNQGSHDRAVSEKKYLKSELQHFGTSMPAIRKIAKGFVRESPAMTRRDLVRLVKNLWAEPVHECRMAAVELLKLRPDLLGRQDARLLEGMIRESKTWALVDGLATTVVGDLVVRYSDMNEVLDEWARDHDFWIRRSTLLALLNPLRAGGGDFERFGRYADTMLEDKEFFIRKAIGWVLRETSKKRPDLVYEWLAPRAGRASGLTVREAVKYLPATQAEEIVASNKRKGVRAAGSPSRP
jgi:3-methyladenine DNA glycosylase AlkD